jgi:hypothetical protein
MYKRVLTYPEPENGGVVPRTLSPELLELSYQNRLRTIGRHLDLNSQRSILIIEVDGGFVVRCVSRLDRDVDLLEFSDETYADRMIRATEARGQGERLERHSVIAPTGYEDLLRAVGRLADERSAAAIVVAEVGESLLLRGDEMSNGRVQPFELTLQIDEITMLLDESFRLRFRDGS